MVLEFLLHNSLWNFNQVLKSVHSYSSSRSRSFWLSSHLSFSIHFPRCKTSSSASLIFASTSSLHFSISWTSSFVANFFPSIVLLKLSISHDNSFNTFTCLSILSCPPAFVFFPSFFRGWTEVDWALRRKLTLPLSCFKTEVVSLYFNSLQFIWSRRRCHLVGNLGPLIHRNLWQFTWCSFIHNNEPRSHSFCNSLTHRYFWQNKLVLIVWSSPFDSPQHTWNLTYIIKWLTFKIISTILIKKPKYFISYNGSLRDFLERIGDHELII